MTIARIFTMDFQTTAAGLCSNQLGALLEKLVCLAYPKKILLESRLEQKNWGNDI